VEYKKSYARAELVSIVSASPNRVSPDCVYYDKCGECQLMHLSYDEQCIQKRQRVVDELSRIARIENAEQLVKNCAHAPSAVNYRNKIQLPVQGVSKHISIGLYKRGSHELIDINTCRVHLELVDEVYKLLRPVITGSDI